MKKAALVVSLAAIGLAVLAGPAAAQAVVGHPAPAFSLTDSNGQTRTLAELKGHTVVLEWWSYECPFVGKHYGSGHMQKLQKEWTAKGVTWLTVSSSGAGKAGYVDAADANTIMRQRGGAPSAILLDHDGALGRAYGAKTTPHMFVIDPQGVLAYAGAIDDRSTPDPDDVKGAKNYVEAAFADVKAGRPVAVGSTAPYGCSVKYSD